MTKQHTSASDSPAPQGDGAPAFQIEVTASMIKAGIEVLDLMGYREAGESESLAASLVEGVFSAMLARAS